MAFCDLMGNMDNAQRMIKSCANYVLENGAEEMEFFDRFIAKGVIDRLDAVRTADFGHVTYTEAIDLLQKADEKFNYPVSWGSTCRPSTSGISVRRSSTVRCSLPTTPRRSRPSTCG